MRRALVGLSVLAALAACALPFCGDHAIKRGAFQVSQPSIVPGRPIVSVKTFGAVGDGAADDRTAINTAMTAACAAGASELFLPPGNYSMSKNGGNPFALDITCDNIAIVGVHGRTVLTVPVGLGNVTTDVVRVNNHKNIVIRDVVIDGKWGNCAARVTLSSNNVALASAPTINVDDASCFPSGTFGAVITDSAGAEFISCTGKTSTTLTGCTGGAMAGGAAIGTLFVDQRIGLVDTNAGINHSTASSQVTTIAAGSNGATLPQATINVASASSFSCGSGCTPWVKTSFGYQLLTCSGATATTFTGCTGGTGTLAVGNEVFAGADAQNVGLRIRGAENVTVEDVDIRQTYGDCIWLGTGTTGGISAPDRNIRIINVNCTMAARDGIGIGGGVDGLVIDNFFAQDIFASVIDGEPVSTFVRNVDVSHSTLGTWFARDTHAGGGNSISVVGGPDNNIWTDGTTARGWHVHDNLMLGTVLIEKSGSVVVENNSIRNVNTAGTSTIFAEFGSQALTIRNNTVYSGGSVSGASESCADCAAIQLFTYQSGTQRSPIGSAEIYGNFVHATHGRHGISIKGGGGTKAGASGTATGVTSTTLTDSGASWTTNQWAGFYVRMGGAVATVASNTATVLTLNVSIGSSSVAWVDGLAFQEATPTAGAYQILWPTGIVSVHDNHIDLTDDGVGGGKYGVNLTNGSNNDTSLRLQLRRNHVKNCDTYAYRLKFDGATNYPLLEVSDNDAHDDQPTATCTNLMRFDGTIRADQIIIGGNSKGEGVTNTTSGLSAGTWLIRDGAVQEWAGFGAPGMSAPKGSTYQRLDPVDGNTVFYVNASGSTTWTAK